MSSPDHASSDYDAEDGVMTPKTALWRRRRRFAAEDGVFPPKTAF
jgi:hypothetical protein